MKNSIVVFLLILSSAEWANAQVTFSVTDVLLANSSGSLDSVLYEAIDSANAGNAVTVLFNASGLIQVNAALPAVTISSGSITFDKSPSASVTQGLQFTASSSDPTVQYGFVISGTDSTTSIVIKNLRFKDFRRYNSSPFIDRGAIYIYNSENIEVTDCQFDYNTWGTYLYGSSGNVRVHYNDFNLDTVNVGKYSDAFFYYNVSPNLIKNQIYFDHNTVSNSLASNLTAYSSAAYVYFIMNASLGYEDSTTIHILSNTLNNCYSGIYLYNNSDSNWDPALQFDVDDNDVKSCAYGIAVFRPLEYWVVKNNTFSSLANPNTRQIDLYIAESHKNGVVPHWNGIDFVEPNTLGYTEFNKGNTWADSSVHSVVTSGMFERGVNLVGLHLNAQVTVSVGKYTTIRQDTILGTSPMITLSSGGNSSLSAPTVVSTKLSGTVLEVKYQLSGTLHTQSNAEFAVDFYKSNASSNLTAYLGSQTIDTITGGTYTTSLSLPSGLLSMGDTIGLTVTAYGNLPSPDTTIGTSAVVYTRIKPYCCDSFSIVTTDTTICLGHDLSLYFHQASCDDSLQVNFGDGHDTILVAGTNSVIHTYDSIGNFTVTVIISGDSANCNPIGDSISVVVRNCEEPACTDCLTSFAPVPGKKYLLSAWVKEENASLSKTSYTYPQIIVYFPSDADTLSPFTPKGAIIDGWQRIEEEFTIPATSTDIAIKLNSVSGNCYFDDIRVLPFDGSLKSYVYDPVSLKLVAELDERNYATLYEYDEEGKLIRVKKETEKGIMTIKENRNSSHK